MKIHKQFSTLKLIIFNLLSDINRNRYLQPLRLHKEQHSLKNLQSTREILLTNTNTAKIRPEKFHPIKSKQTLSKMNKPET